MKGISIRQPWAWLIVRPDIVGEYARARAFGSGAMKDIENRVWTTKQRGQVLVHASASKRFDDYALAKQFVADMHFQDIPLPEFGDFQRGGIVGVVDIVDCVTESDSPWYMGRVGFKLANARALPFVPFKGALQFFNVPDEVLEGVEAV